MRKNNNTMTWSITDRRAVIIGIACDLMSSLSDFQIKAFAMCFVDARVKRWRS